MCCIREEKTSLSWASFFFPKGVPACFRFALECHEYLRILQSLYNLSNKFLFRNLWSSFFLRIHLHIIFPIYSKYTKWSGEGQNFVECQFWHFRRLSAVHCRPHCPFHALICSTVWPGGIRTNIRFTKPNCTLGVSLTFLGIIWVLLGFYYILM